MRPRLEGVPQRCHEDHITAEGVNSLSHYNLVRKFILMHQAIKYSRCKGGGGERMGKTEEKSIGTWLGKSSELQNTKH